VDTEVVGDAEEARACAWSWTKCASRSGLDVGEGEGAGIPRPVVPGIIRRLLQTICDVATQSNGRPRWGAIRQVSKPREEAE
jgi:hypothetical protein